MEVFTGNHCALNFSKIDMINQLNYTTMTPDEESYQFMAKLDKMKTPYMTILLPFLSVISIFGELKHWSWDQFCMFSLNSN